MKRRFFMLAILALFPIALFSAEPIQVINLKDNTIIRGEVLGMQNRIYTVKTQTLGTLTIPADQILSIVAEEAAGSPPPAIIDGRQNQRGNYQQRQPVRNRPNSLQQKGQANRPALAPDAQKMQDQAQSRVQSMMMNPNFTDQVTGLNGTNEMQDVLNDPETMNAINNFDYDSLMNNPKMQKLMDSPAIREFLGESGGR